MMNQSFIKGYNQRAADKEIILRQYSRNLIFDVLYRVGDGYGIWGKIWYAIKNTEIGLMESKNNMDKTDEGLLGNEKIEEAIAALQQQPTQELLAHALTVVRRRMRENGQVIIAVEPNAAAGQMKLQAVKTSDGNSWWAVFTSFEEELKGSGSVMSTFMTDIGKVLEAALSEEEISGVIINPWNRTLMLDKTLIRIVLGDVTQ